ncbi:DNA cytosine methyltransferase [Helicobacter ailurogastricus]|uniref:DNA cytosine methyltransferase n=1 Tax=Helicobacter ailurogastricus TaxID=1578720 RepID=UPI00244D7FBE|nr:DNA cytosine methyltransferase [Helicobacter ailurogastricus]GMB91471.1 DNA cytosine methyltransferase [Helicobacter ailurogastricus]
MTCVDLFCGCGGMSLGFQLAGFKMLKAFDHWECALKVYRQNFAHEALNVDLSNPSLVIPLLLELKPQIIIGGPPCQDFSSAGKRDMGSRAHLTHSYTDIVCAIKPEWFVMENVAPIRKSAILDICIHKFKQAGYGLTSVILNAAYCQVPQSRVRFFLIGCLNGGHNALLHTLKQRLTKSPMSVRDYLGDTLGIQHYYRHPRSYQRRAVFSIDEPSPTIRGVNRPIPKHYQLKTYDPSGVDLRALRPLSTLERSYLQTFPQDFIFKGTKTDLEQMIGNAVPVNLARCIAQAIREHAQADTKPHNPQTFMLADKPLHQQGIQASLFLA